MTKHFGPIIVWIVVAGIALYVIRNFGDLLSGFSVLRQTIESRM